MHAALLSYLRLSPEATSSRSTPTIKQTPKEYFEDLGDYLAIHVLQELLM
jgi:hypothetical protein